MAKKSLSQLTPASAKKLAKAMGIKDLQDLCVLGADVKAGKAPIEEYHKMELEMCQKYGFKVK